MTDWATRRTLLERIEKVRKSKVLLYVTGDRPGQETQISSDVIDHLSDHLDAIGVTNRISLILYTRGGDGMAAWNIANLIRMFCNDFEVIVPLKAHSAGTIIALGSDRVVMTKQATLSPIDPSINHALAPQVPGAPPGTRAPVSVEAIQGYIDLAQGTLGADAEKAMAGVMVDLSRQVHPLVLGEAFRRRQQAQEVAEKLLAQQVTDAKSRKKIISFLCSDSGSHDYVFNRREAHTLGLNIEKCSAELYEIVKDLYVSFREEMQLRSQFSPAQISQNGPAATVDIRNVRSLVEGTEHPPVQFISSGKLTSVPPQPPQNGNQWSLTWDSESWRIIR